MDKKFLWIGGAGVGLVALFMFTRGSSSGSSDTSQTGDVTYVGPTVPSVNPTSGGGITDAGLGQYFDSQFNTYLAALGKQFKLAQSDQITQGLLDMYQVIAPGVDVQRGFTQDFSASIDQTESGSVVSFHGQIQPNEPNQDLLDQIDFLGNVNTDLTNRINLLSDSVTSLTSANASLTSGKTLAEQQSAADAARAASLQTRVNTLTDALARVRSFFTTLSSSGISSQKTPSGTSKSLYDTGLSGIAGVLASV